MGDYSLFLSSWHSPSGGIHGYLSRFLSSGDATFQHIAIWTLLQLLESEDPQLLDVIRASQDVMAMVREISERTVESEDETDATADSEDGEGEVAALAKRCLDLAEVGQATAGAGTGAAGPNGSQDSGTGVNA